jgi:hypothetical protein
LLYCWGFINEEKKSDPSSKKGTDYIDVGDEEIEGEASTDSHSDTLEGEDQSSPMDQSSAHSSGAGRTQDGLRKIESIDLNKVVGGITSSFENLSNIQKMVLVVVASLAVGSITGYGVGSAPIKEYREEIYDLGLKLGEINQSLVERSNALDICESNSLELDERLDDLSVIVDENQIQIEGLTQEIEDLQEYALHISEVELDASNGLAYVTIVNPTSIQAIITSISLESGESYKVSGDVRIAPDSSQRIVWMEEDANALSGFIQEEKYYHVVAKTLTGYTLEHWYIDLQVQLLVYDWNFRDNQLIVSVIGHTDEAYPSLEVTMISLMRLYEEDPVYYNVSYPTPYDEEDLTLGWGRYVWSEEEAYAPQGFLWKNYYYRLKVTYDIRMPYEHATYKTRVLEKIISYQESGDSPENIEEEPIEP